MRPGLQVNVQHCTQPGAGSPHRCIVYVSHFRNITTISSACIMYTQQFSGKWFFVVFYVRDTMNCIQEHATTDFHEGSMDEWCELHAGCFFYPESILLQICTHCMWSSHCSGQMSAPIIAHLHQNTKRGPHIETSMFDQHSRGPSVTHALVVDTH